MKRRLQILSSMLVLTCLIASCCAAQAEETGVLYRVSGGKNEMVVLGSIHVGSSAMYPMSRSILQAMEQADVFVFECDTQSEQAVRDTTELMYYTGGKKLRNAVSASTFSLLKKAADVADYPLSMLSAMKPWAVVSLFSVQTTAAEMGMEDISEALELGVEKQVTALVGGREVRYLETARQQLEMMDSFSPELQEYMLLSACRDVIDPQNVQNASLRFWPDWWRTGDVQRFADAYLQDMNNDGEPELMKEYHQALITMRNRQMAKKLAEMLEETEERRFFVTIGLLHLALPGDSVINELENMGYHVQRVLP